MLTRPTRAPRAPRAFARCTIAAALVAGAALALTVAACGPPGPRDAAGDRVRRGDRGRPDAGTDASAELASVPEAPPQAARPREAGAPPRVVAKAASRALAMDATRLYFGDANEDGVFAIDKAGGGAPVRLARRAPVAGALAFDRESLAWIASPGDAVLRVPVKGGNPATLRDGGIFAGVAAEGGDVFIAEALGAGGAVLRVTGATAARIASFDGAPRGLVVDHAFTYIVTPTKIFRAPHEKGDLETLATGSGFEWPALAGDSLYVLADGGRRGQRAIVAVPRTGGAPKTIASDVRDAPIAVEGAELFYFDAALPQLRAVALPGGALRVLAEHTTLAAPTAMAVDATTVFVATGVKESGLVVAVPRRP